MLRTYLEPDLQIIGVEVQTVWFQQVGATARTARNAMRVLIEVSPVSVILRRRDYWMACKIAQSQRLRLLPLGISQE